MTSPTPRLLAMAAGMEESMLLPTTSAARSPARSFCPVLRQEKPGRIGILLVLVGISFTP